MLTNAFNLQLEEAEVKTVISEIKKIFFVFLKPFKTKKTKKKLHFFSKSKTRQKISVTQKPSRAHISRGFSWVRV